MSRAKPIQGHQSIAILPFENLSGKDADAGLAGRTVPMHLPMIDGNGFVSGLSEGQVLQRLGTKGASVVLSGTCPQPGPLTVTIASTEPLHLLEESEVKEPSLTAPRPPENMQVDNPRP